MFATVATQEKDDIPRDGTRELEEKDEEQGVLLFLLVLPLAVSFVHAESIP